MDDNGATDMANFSLQSAADRTIMSKKASKIPHMMIEEEGLSFSGT